MNKKYAITGHTSGIGKELFDQLSPDCMGFSKSTGFDITHAKDRYKIIENSKDCHIFINNATSGMGQTLMLIDWFRMWKDTSKVIVNVGSRIADRADAVPRTDLLVYQSEKLILKEMALRLNGVGVCNVLYRSFGYVGTEKILDKYPHFKYPEDYITEDEACNIILS